MADYTRIVGGTVPPSVSNRATLFSNYRQHGMTMIGTSRYIVMLDHRVTSIQLNSTITSHVGSVFFTPAISVTGSTTGVVSYGTGRDLLVCTSSGYLYRYILSANGRSLSGTRTVSSRMGMAPTGLAYIHQSNILLASSGAGIGGTTNKIRAWDYSQAGLSISNPRYVSGSDIDGNIQGLAYNPTDRKLYAILQNSGIDQYDVTVASDGSVSLSNRFRLVNEAVVFNGITYYEGGGLKKVLVGVDLASNARRVYSYSWTPDISTPPEAIDVTDAATRIRNRMATAMDTVAVSESVSVGVVRAGERRTVTDTIAVSDMATRTRTHVRRAREMPFLTARAQLTGTLSGGSRGPEAATIIGDKIIASLSNQIWDYDYDPDTATISNPRVLLDAAALSNTVSFERFVTGMTHLPNGNILMTDRSYGRLLEVSYDPVRGMSRPVQPRSAIHSMLRISDIVEEGITVSPSGRRVIILDGRSNVLYDAVYSAGVLSRGRTLGPVGAGSHGVLYHPPSGLLLVTYVDAASIASFAYDEDAGTITPDNSLSAATGGTPTGLGHHAESGRIVCVRNDRRADHYMYVDPAPVITDMATATYRRIRRLSDSIGVAGVATRVRGRARRAMDRITISDMAEGIAQGLARVSDSIDISGVATRLRRSRRTASDDTAITDEATAKLRATRTAEDSISIRESVSVAIEGLVDVAESIPISDMATATYTRFRKITDAIPVSEMATRATGKARQAADTAVRITDAAKARISGVSAAEEHVDVTDTATASRRATRTAGDSITISDIANTMLGGLARAADTIHITDMATRMISAVRTAGDSITFSESASTTKVREHSVQVGETESIPVTDSAIRRLNAARRVTDQIHVSDMATALRRIRRSVSDAIHITDHAVTDRFRSVNRTVAKLGADLGTTTLRIPSNLNRTSIINISKLVPEKLRLVRKAT